MFPNPVNGTDGLARDYRGLLVAKVTAKHEPASGVLSGRKVYEWTEQSMSLAGGDEDAAQGRAGVYTSATNFDGVLLDANDADLTIDSYVWARVKGSVGGATVYETVSNGAAPAAAGSSDCASDFFLTQILATACWDFYRRGGTGRFADFPVDDPDNSDDGGSLGVYVAAESTPPDQLAFLGKMLDTCCGCGVPVLRVNKAGAKGSRATMELNGVHVACTDDSGASGAAGEVFTLTLAEYCPVVVGGRKGLLFTGYDARACDGDDAACGSEVKILALCGADCPPTVCDCQVCGACCTGPAPFLYYALGLDTFSDHRLRGSWAWVHTTDCTWVGTCNGVTSTIEFVEFDAGLPKFRLTHGDAVYEVTGWSCCAANTFTKVGGDGPAAITVKPAGACDSADCEDAAWPDTLFASASMTLAGGATNPYPGTAFPLTKQAGSPWTPQIGWASAYYPNVYDGGATETRLIYACNNGESYPGCSGFGTSADTFPANTGVGSGLIDCACVPDPVFYEALNTGSFECVTIGGCGWGPQGATVSDFHVTITE